MAKKRGLGRGLDALLGGVELQSPPTNTGSDQQSVENMQPAVTTFQIAEKIEDSLNKDYKLLPVDQISRGDFQPRQHFDQESLQELADSIASQGLIQPIVVRKQTSGYELIAGERRWRAAQLAGLHEIPAMIKELDNKSAAAVALIENIQREDLNPIEEAHALQRLQAEFGMTHQSVAESVGRSRATVTNLLRLLDLNDGVKELVDLKQLDMGHARALLALPYDQQLSVANEIINKGLSVRATEQLIKKLKDAKNSTQQKIEAVEDPDVKALQMRLSDTLGASVEIKQGKKGKGKLVISYTSLDELDGILGHIQ